MPRGNLKKEMIAMSEDALINLTESQKAARVVEAEKIITESDRLIELGTALSEMKASDNYQLVFDEYFHKYALSIFEEMTNPIQFARVPLKDCEDTLAGIKALKSFLGVSGFAGKVELDAQVAVRRKVEAEAVLDALIEV